MLLTCRSHFAVLLPHHRRSIFCC